MPYERYNFTDDFQDTILSCLIRYPEHFWAFGDIIRPEYFSGTAAVQTVFHLRHYVKEFGKYPNFVTLANYVVHEMQNKGPDQVKENLAYIAELAEVDTNDWEAILKMSRRFAKERAIYDAVKKIAVAQTEGKESEIDPVKLMEEACRVGENVNRLGVEIHLHLEEVVDRLTDDTFGIHTGYNELDKIWKRGWHPGWLITVLAPPKNYKTAFCLNLARQMASPKINSDILYYACEISEELAMMRTVFAVSGQSEATLDEGKHRFLKRARKSVDDLVAGHMWYKHFPAKTATIADIKSHARMVCDIYELKPKAIFIDYAETVRPSNTGQNVPDWRQQADIYTEARGLGDDLGAAIIMPDRCNKDAVGKKVPSMKSFQGSFEKAGIVDAAIGLCSTDAEYQQHKIRYFIFLNRHGPMLKHFEGKVDPALMQMTIDKEIDYDPDAEDKAENDFPHRGKRKRVVASNAEITQSD